MYMHVVQNLEHLIILQTTPMHNLNHKLNCKWTTQLNVCQKEVQKNQVTRELTRAIFHLILQCSFSVNLLKRVENDLVPPANTDQIVHF